MKTSTASFVLVLALLLLAGISELSAQGTGTDGRSTGAPSTMKQPGAGEKIPAHQQPKATDVPKTNNGGYIDQLSAEDKALDRKLKGICRGC